MSSELREVSVPVATMWTSPEAPRDLDADAVRDVPDALAWAAGMDAQTRLGLHGRTLTQLLLGEPVQVLEERGEWLRVVAPWQSAAAHEAGYPGWVRAAHLGEPVAADGAQTADIVSRSALCAVDDGTPVELSFGTRLAVGSVGDEHVSVLLPGDRRGTLPTRSVRLAAAEQPADMVDLAGMFLGLRYLWGGTSTWGLDCSGLVHLVLRSQGVPLPRDASDQAACDRVEPVALDEVRRGDLYFFARPGERIYHVGFASRPVEADGTRWMLHAPEGGGLIEDAPMAPHRLETLVSAGRVRADVPEPQSAVAY
jgi:cell wall-associated NlpC family hydrolase